MTQYHFSFLTTVSTLLLILLRCSQPYLSSKGDQSQSDNGLRSRIQNYLNRTSATPNAPITLANAATLLQDLAAAQISSHTLPDSSTSQAKVKTRKVGTRPRHSNASLVYAPT
ncbi:uncharacterized protein EI90DRAFT_3104688 [Cantharellus anzutake]|uniref:uncharacterized protein n=1 Tax=Cantharellus anzutake TaxID=1750568 RepID=UPI001908B11E|nr:uncharacterized protein EI90DRAFT_3104688 [Cantharellus anzutake]KAF8309528.1 hypothetical protein EI90DRAFT_3104688 [Cantharellus anzutake]